MVLRDREDVFVLGGEAEMGFYEAATILFDRDKGGIEARTCDYERRSFF